MACILILCALTLTEKLRAGQFPPLGKPPCQVRKPYSEQNVSSEKLGANLKDTLVCNIELLHTGVFIAYWWFYSILGGLLFVLSLKNW